jgi:hypothetical protein
MESRLPFERPLYSPPSPAIISGFLSYLSRVPIRENWGQDQ